VKAGGKQTLTKLILPPRRWRRYSPLKRWLTFNGLHGVISHRSKNLKSYILNVVSIYTFNIVFCFGELLSLGLLLLMRFEMAF
jgi:hypothetical protein